MKNLDRNLPIGVFDSGIGGLTVLKELQSFLPGESFIYYGDNVNAPYGNKSIKQLKELSKRAVNILMKSKVKAIVIACNTLSTNLYNYIKDCAHVPVVKTTPLISSCENDCLLCTVKTSESEFVKKNYKCSVIGFETLAQEIEKNVFNLSAIDLSLVLSRIPLTTERIILGCTHYHFIKPMIKTAFKVPVVDGVLKVKIDLLNELKKHRLFSLQKKGSVKFVGDSYELNCKVYNEILD